MEPITYLQTDILDSKIKLYKKLHRVMGETGYIQKKGHNKFHNYKYAQEADILEHLRPALLESGIFFCVRVVSTNREKIDKAQKGESKVEFFTTVNLVAEFGDIDTGYSIQIPFSGDGLDSGDKGIYKAYTGGLKYLLMKNFLLPTGDDPELEGEEEKAGKKEANKQAKVEALASQARVNQEAEVRQRKGEPLAELAPKIPLPTKPVEALKKEMSELIEFQGINSPAFFSACVGGFKKIVGDWTATEYTQAVQFLKDMVDGKLTLEVFGGQGSFKRFEEPPGEIPSPDLEKAISFKIKICQEIWEACVAKAWGTGESAEEVLKTVSSFTPKGEGGTKGKLKWLTLMDLQKATKSVPWFEIALKKLDIPEKDIPF